jgi:peptidoglycan/LPS O-acetylase OafA/YrhL
MQIYQKKCLYLKQSFSLQCMFQSWYIACDMHYFLIAPLIVIPLYKKPKLGLSILGTVIALTIIIPFAVTYVGEYSGVLRVYMRYVLIIIH